MKEALGDFDLFDELEGDAGTTFNGDNRRRDYIGYITPTFAESFRLTVNFFPSEDPEAGDNGVADGMSVALDYRTDRLYAAIAHDRDVDGVDVETLRLVGGYTHGPAQVMLLYQRADVDATDEEGFGASVAWRFGNSTAKLQYLDAALWRIDPQPDPLENLYDSLLSLGLDHAIDANTKLFGFYTTGDIGGTSAENEYLAIGIKHEF